MKLVKVDIDKNPAYAGQLRVQSIPAVFAFVGGKPVDGFMGALPDSQVKAFVDKLAKMAKAGGPSPVDEILALAKESLDLGDMGGAAQAYAQVLQADPANVKALGGLARVYMSSGDAERAQEVVAMAPADAKGIAYAAALFSFPVVLIALVALDPAATAAAASLSLH